MASDWGYHGMQSMWSTPSRPRTAVSGQRSRISRACDRCHALRAKCNGSHPCSRCAESKEICEYDRGFKKRGKASKKSLGARDGLLSAAKPASRFSHDQARWNPDQGPYSPVSNPTSSSVGSPERSGAAGYQQRLNVTSNPNDTHTAEDPVRAGFGIFESGPHHTNPIPAATPTDAADGQPLNSSLTFEDDESFRFPHYVDDGLQAYDQLAFDVAGAELLCGDPHKEQSPRFQSGLSKIASQTASAIPNVANESSGTFGKSLEEPFKYPVLEALAGFLNVSFEKHVAEKLLEDYFDSLFDSSPHPLSPYLFGFMLRKKAVLHPSQPRVSSPAMLASMLWISARTSDMPELSSEPTKRGELCQYLLQITLSFLLPVMQNPALNNALPATSAVSSPNQRVNTYTKQKLSLDDIIAYIHISTVTSASEDKRASLRWWTSAWQLARELKLGRELDASETPQTQSVHPSTHLGPNDEIRTPAFVWEEHREERRRVWWILYILDRHLGLCYNRALFLPDRECPTLLQPVDEVEWQSGGFFTHPAPDRIRGPSILYTSPSLFGFFLPLATILGEIVELQSVRTHTLLSLGASTFEAEVLSRVRVVEDHLVQYRQSLYAWSLHAKQTQPNDDVQAQNETALAYAEHIMHVLHILVTGRWDPIDLLDDADSWASTESFQLAAEHAVAGAQAVHKILNVDPDLSFMPFLFGVYLLQGSFLLLFMTEIFQASVSPHVAEACETVVRAHEVCIVTLSTEYQKNFRNVMRSALAQVCGRQRKDSAVQRKKRREVLALYRWKNDGYGLAL